MNKKVIVVFLTLFLAVTAGANITLPGLISDHMVLQLETVVRIWGWADAGEKVTVDFNGQTVSTKADSGGKWTIRLKPMKAGGPHALNVTGNNKITLKDVLVGEVWLASGQSNMAMTVSSSKNCAEETAAANYPKIRYFRVGHEPTGSPIEEITGQWEVCSPVTVGNFSATGYFFARYLHSELKVPVGIINSSWGGTPAEAWTPLATLKQEKINPGLIHMYEQTLPHYKEVYQQYLENTAKYEKKRKDGKLLDRQRDQGNQGAELGWAKSDYNDKNWNSVDLPRTVDDLLGGDGAIWFRREVIIPAAWAGHPILLSLGSVDDHDVTYWNGTKIGETNSKTNPADWWVATRKYTIPGNLVTAGKTVLAIRVFDDLGSGGMTDLPENVYLEDARAGEKIPLAGTWRWRVEVTLDPSQLASPPGPPFGPNNPCAPGTLFNSMLFPLRYYAIRGAVWYQGESNVGLYAEYPKLLSNMIQEWRRLWNDNDLPFGIVQLANFMAIQSDPNTGSAWAGLREAQTKVSQTVPNTGLAVAIDIGDAGDIHPKNKQEIGRRLGLWALSKVYGQGGAYSGPIYRSIKKEGSKIRVFFDHGDGGLMVKCGSELKGFSIAGADGKYVWANAKIENDTVVVWSDKIPRPVSVRYAWADNPVCNLYNNAGLPASPFRTDQ